MTTDSVHGWSKSEIAGPGPYRVEYLRFLGAYIVVDSRGANCWTRGTGQIATRNRQEAQDAADYFNGGSQ